MQVKPLKEPQQTELRAAQGTQHMVVAATQAPEYPTNPVREECLLIACSVCVAVAVSPCGCVGSDTVLLTAQNAVIANLSHFLSQLLSGVGTVPTSGDSAGTHEQAHAWPPSQRRAVAELLRKLLAQLCPDEVCFPADPAPASNLQANAPPPPPQSNKLARTSKCTAAAQTSPEDTGTMPKQSHRIRLAPPPLSP